MTSLIVNMKLLIGTFNQGKLKEYINGLSGLSFELISLNDLSDIKEVKETGKTLEENACLKAKGYAEQSGLMTLADDTALEVEALNGGPGIYSARYAPDDKSRRGKMLAELQSAKNRKARFRCVICLAAPSGNTQCVEGQLVGEILSEERGANGFGFDPIFYVPELKKTLAELSLEEKNKISHRAKAMKQARMLLKKFY